MVDYGVDANNDLEKFKDVEYIVNQFEEIYIQRNFGGTNELMLDLKNLKYKQISNLVVLEKMRRVITSILCGSDIIKRYSIATSYGRCNVSKCVLETIGDKCYLHT